MKSVLQDWVQDLGLRHQGVLLTAVRGCDTSPRDDPSKLLTRCFRDAILNAHCGDARKSASFIERVPHEVLLKRMNDVVRDHDALPHHYLMHLVHAAEILGYKHPDDFTRAAWNSFYVSMTNKLHMAPETEAELDRRLDADEATFAARQ